MKRALAFILAGTVLLMSGCSKKAENGATSPQAAASLTAEQKEALLRDAYLFTFPLMVMDATQKVFTNTVEASGRGAPVNQFGHSTALATSDFKSVVTPNVDTVYSQLFMDLREEPLVFTKPAADRYCSMQILDAWTNCAAILGTGGDTQDARQYLLAGPGYAGDVPEGLTRVDIPTNMAWMIVRTVVDGQEDMPGVAKLQAGMDILPLSAWQAGAAYEPPVGSHEELNQTPPELVMAMAMDAYFTKANELMASNPPAAGDAEMLSRLSEIGVGPGLPFAASLSEEAGAEKWSAIKEQAMKGAMQSLGGFIVPLGAWGGYIGEPVAEFGAEYAFRAAIALEGLGANPVSVAVYSKAALDDKGEALNGANNYTIHFAPDSLPPTEENGFWSITMYGEDNYLIDNEIGRYVINDRSNLVFNEDGSLDIFVGAEPPEDERFINNWLPSGEDGFHLFMRIYLPAQDVIDGVWQAPAVRRVS